MRSFAFLVAGLVTVAPAAAQDMSQSSQLSATTAPVAPAPASGVATDTKAVARNTSVRKGLDPNRVICRTEEMIGSRLQTEKRCLTAAQWEDLRRDTRQTVNRVQAFRPQNGG